MVRTLLRKQHNRWKNFNTTNNNHHNFHEPCLVLSQQASHIGICIIIPPMQIHSFGHKRLPNNEPPNNGCRNICSTSTATTTGATHRISSTSHDDHGQWWRRDYENPILWTAQLMEDFQHHHQHSQQVFAVSILCWIPLSRTITKMKISSMTPFMDIPPLFFWINFDIIFTMFWSNWMIGLETTNKSWSRCRNMWIQTYTSHKVIRSWSSRV